MTDVPHRKYGNKWRWVRGFAYLSLAAAGAAVIASPPQSYESLGLWLTYAWGLALLVPGVLAALGALIPRYRWEWIALPFLASGTGLYCLMSWGQVVASGSGHAPRAHVLFAMTLLLAARFIQLVVDDRDARLHVRAEGAVRCDE